jgi:two-component sensor histidine kinase/HAMP domain-containing protein
MRLNLSNKIILISTTILVLTIAAATTVCIIFFMREYSAALVSRGLLIGGVLSQQLERLLRYDIPLNNLTGFEEQCQDLKRNHENVSYAMVIDLNGKVLFHDRPERQGQSLEDQAILKSLKESKAAILEEKEAGGEFYNILVPVRDPEKFLVAGVVLGFPKNLVIRKAIFMSTYAAAMALIFLGLGGLSLIMLLRFWVTEPLAQLLTAIKAIRTTGTDQAVLVNIESRDEIGELGEAFNDMVLELQRSHGQLRQYNQELEERVRESTAYLREANKQLQQDIQARQQAEAALRDSLSEKVALLKEVHHRVKNNLQIVASLVNLQTRRTENPDILAVLEDMRNRVHSMALLHETLYRSDNLALVNLHLYVGELCRELLRSSGPVGSRISMENLVPPLGMPLEQSVPCGLIINELVTNALKHAFPGNRSGTVKVSLTPEAEGNLRLQVVDDGVGTPDGLNIAEAPRLGLRLISNLADQLGGSLTVAPGNDGGTSFAVIFPSPCHQD